MAGLHAEERHSHRARVQGLVQEWGGCAPNQPIQSIPVPSTTNARLCGTCAACASHHDHSDHIQANARRTTPLYFGCCKVRTRESSRCTSELNWRGPTTKTEASAANPAEIWTTIPPAKSTTCWAERVGFIIRLYTRRHVWRLTPHTARKPFGFQIQCANGQ
jgi:hypothetical protein